LSQVIIPLTGVQYEIEGGHYRATVTELGSGLRELAFHGQPVFAGHQADELPRASCWPPGRTGSTAGATSSAAPNTNWASPSPPG